MPRPYLDIEDRFWSRVNKGEVNQCWKWKAATSNGYGMMRVIGKQIYAHRISYLLLHGDLPKGLICHKCDNRGCVNPNHLYLGDHSTNNNDRSIRLPELIGGGRPRKH